jgi:hypothetical protein
MGLVDMLKEAAAGVAVGLTVVTALPIFGAVGTVTAAGAAVGATIGAAAGAYDAVRKEEDNN